MKEPEINLNGWCTIKTLAEKLNHKNTTYVSTNVKRGKIPSRTIPELNGLKLVPADWKPE